MAKYRFDIRFEKKPVPIIVEAISYKFKRNFLTLNLTTNKIVVYNLNKLERFEMEIIDEKGD